MHVFMHLVGHTHRIRMLLCRWLFNLEHWYIGRIVACLAIANVYVGLNQVQPYHVGHYYIAYTVIIGVMFLAWLAKGMLFWRREPLLLSRPEHYQQSKQFMQGQAAFDSGHGNESARGVNASQRL